MRVALVIQGSLQFLGGGELVCISTCSALQGLGYHVKLVSDRFRPDEVEAAFGLGGVVKKCEPISWPGLGRRLSRYSSIPGLYFAGGVKRLLQDEKADVVFVTRDPPRPYVLPDRQFFRFMYEIEQLRPFWERYNPWVRSLWQARYGNHHPRTTFLALSTRLSSELRQAGQRSVELVYPCYGVGFRLRPKKNQVVYVTFPAPQKRLDDFMEIARRLPQYRFLLVGRDTKRMNRIYEGYAQRVLDNKPSNVEYIEARIRQAPELLEESRIYLHTSTETGMGIAVMEALSAGCLPVAPRVGGAGEVLEVARVGFRYDTIEDATDFIRSELEGGANMRKGSDRGLTPADIAERAKMFSPEAFRNRLEEIIEKRISSVGGSSL